jgi:hypothetical protein
MIGGAVTTMPVRCVAQQIMRVVVVVVVQGETRQSICPMVVGRYHIQLVQTAVL